MPEYALGKVLPVQTYSREEKKKVAKNVYNLWSNTGFDKYESKQKHLSKNSCCFNDIFWQLLIWLMFFNMMFFNKTLKWVCQCKNLGQINR